MPLYACYGVAFAWLVDPLATTLGAFALEGRAWRALGTWQGDESASVPPFEAIPLALAEVWRR